jgi:hypothetical protein
MEVAVAGSDVPLSKTVVLNIAKAEPANAPFRPKPPVVPKGVDVTGSVEPTKKTDAAAGKDAPSTKTEAVITAKAEAANAPVPEGVDVTGSVKHTKKTDQKQRRSGWRWDWYPPPPGAFGMRVYP